MDLNIKGIVFDKDGVLFDFRATWEVWAERFLLRAAKGDRELAKSMGDAVGFDLDQHRFERTSVVIAGTPAEIASVLRPFVPDMTNLVETLNDEARTAPQVETVPLVPLMSQLRQRGMRLGVATNDGAAPAKAHLAAVGAETMFDFVAGYDSGYGGKPEPGQLLEFCRREDLMAAQCIMVGDSLHDMMAAKAAGMSRIAVLTGMATHEDLAPHADAVLPDIGHLPTWLDNQPAT